MLESAQFAGKELEHMNPLLQRGVPVVGEDDDGKFDERLPHDGWDISLNRNTFLGEVVGQLPRSSKIIVPSLSNARNDKEWHLIVHQISPILDEHCHKINLELGDRVVISGSATECFFNGMSFVIVPYNAIQAILRRTDGELFVGSKYGKDAISLGRAASQD